MLLQFYRNLPPEKSERSVQNKIQILRSLSFSLEIKCSLKSSVLTVEWHTVFSDMYSYIESYFPEMRQHKDLCEIYSDEYIYLLFVYIFLFISFK